MSLCLHHGKTTFKDYVNEHHGPHDTPGKIVLTTGIPSAVIIMLSIGNVLSGASLTVASSAVVSAPSSS